MTIRWNLTGLSQSYSDSTTGLEAVLSLLSNGFILGIDFTIQ